MEAKDDFLTILKDLMDEKELSFEKLSAKININPRTMRRWKENCNPKLSSLLKLSEFFDCSLDYLFGFTNEFARHVSAVPTTFLTRYNQLKEEKHLKDYHICKLCDVASSTISEWHEGIEPELPILLKLRNLFGCSLDYLAGISDF